MWRVAGVSAAALGAPVFVLAQQPAVPGPKALELGAEAPPDARLTPPWTDPLAELGIEIELGYTLIGQAATAAAEDQPVLLTGSYDFAGLWHAVDHPTLGRGQAGWLIEGGQVWTSSRDEDLSANVGSGLGVNDDLDNQDIAVTELWWAQTLPGGLTLTAGKIDQTVYLDANRIANDETTQFLSTSMVNNPAVAFPDNGLGLNVHAPLGEAGYLAASLGDANADARETGFSTAGEGDVFVAGEVGWTPAIGGPERGAYRLLLWRSEVDGGGSGEGVAVSLDQPIGGGWVPFFRFGWADDGLADFELFVSGGVGLEAPFGRGDDLLALGVAWGEPADGSRQSETLIEAFYRWQVHPNLALTPDAQVIFNPADNRGDGVVAVLGLRAQVVF